MSSIGTGYDLSASQFSPDGRVFQVDYASKAIEKSGTLIGFRGKDGVVLAVEKIINSSLYEKDAGERIFTIGNHIGIAIAGVLADGRHIVNIATQEAENYLSQNDAPIPIHTLTFRLSAYMHAHTLYSSIRPFGATVLLSSYNEHKGSQLYKLEPSGTSYGYIACAAGKAKQMAKTEMEKYSVEKMSIDNLVQAASKIVYQAHDELKDKNFRLEIGIVGKKTNGRHLINPEPWYTMAIESGENYKIGDESDNEI